MEDDELGSEWDGELVRGSLAHVYLHRGSWHSLQSLRVFFSPSTRHFSFTGSHVHFHRDGIPRCGGCFFRTPRCWDWHRAGEDEEDAAHPRWSFYCCVGDHDPCPCFANGIHNGSEVLGWESSGCDAQMGVWRGHVFCLVCWTSVSCWRGFSFCCCLHGRSWSKAAK